MPDKTSRAEIIIVENESRNSRLISLQGILENKFIVPVYQRPYAWNTENFKELLATIKESKEQGLPAFFGSVIVAEKPDPTNIIKGYILIDGQQRLTSFLLLLKLVRERLLKKEEHLAEKQKEHTDTRIFKEVVLEENKVKEVREKIDNILNNKHRIAREHTSNNHRSKELAVEEDILNYIFYDKQLANVDLRENPKIFAEWLDDVDEGDFVEQTTFILERSQFCFLVVQGKLSEDYAIDIFNTLNATGVPLTAFEILKSLSHKKTKQKDGEGNPETVRLNNIEGNLRDKKMKKVKQTKYTDRLLLFLSMMHKDLKTEKFSTFRDKKAFLDNVSKTHAKCIPEYINTICTIHKFIIENWETPSKHRKLFKNNGEEAICFDFLQAINHDRTLPILFKFKDNRYSEDAVKACVAFTCLWRGVASDANTDRIDQQYKEVTEKIYQEEADIYELKKIFREHLRGKWKNMKGSQRDFTRETWVEDFAAVNIYKKIKLARFMLFMAFHESIFDHETCRLEKSKLKFLTANDYESNDYKTVEHIVPQRRKTINKIGNLILLPQEINSRASAKNFIDKKIIYQECLAKEKHEGDDLPYLRILREIVSYDDNDVDEHNDLNNQAITTRGIRLGNAIWDTIAEDWLAWD